MSAIRSTGNKTEEALRKALHAAGLRYRKYAAGLPGKPDIVFVKARVVVFVDGDFWHGRLLIDQGRRALNARFRHLPAKGRAYWREKFSQRVHRDREVTAELEGTGWLVIRFWESDLKRNMHSAVRRVATVVRRRTKNRT